MKKQLAILLILALGIGLIPNNIAEAITSTQLSAEVQIVCTDGKDNWFSGSGTIIDSKGIILTNRHVVEGAYANTCFIGFIRSISQEPDFGTKSSPNLAEVKYKTTTSDMDAAVLYLDNPNNNIYPYVNIWNSDSSTLKFGDKLEVVGYPSVGGSTITYTSGDFSGFGSVSDGTKNFIKTTAQLEHGNSGGAAYNSAGQFMGIPTMVIAGTLSSMNYVLSVNSIKSWLSGILGTGYKQEIIEQKPIIEEPKVSLQDDITPPNFNVLNQLCYYIYDNTNTSIGGRCFPKNMGKIEPFNRIQFEILNNELTSIDSSGLKKIYYYFDTKPQTKIDSEATEYEPISIKQTLTISEIIDIENPGKYFFTFFGEDNAGNISNPYIYEYTYQPEIFKSITDLYFYKDSNKNQSLKAFDANFDNISQAWMFEPLECYTRLNNLTIGWEYPTDYKQYTIKKINSFTDFFATKYTGSLQSSNQYTMANLLYGNTIEWKENYYQTGNQIYQKNLPPHNNIFYEFYMNPTDDGNNELEGKHRFLKLIYDKNINQDLVCNNNLVFTEKNNYSNNTNQDSSKPTAKSLSNRLSGRLLLQVEQGGAIWYVDTNDNKRYNVTWLNALLLFEKLSLGITNTNLEKIPLAGTSSSANTTFRNQLKGKLLLQVEQGGAIWYVDKDGYRHSVTWKNLLPLFESLSLGITDADLNKIEIGSLN